MLEIVLRLLQQVLYIADSLLGVIFNLFLSEGFRLFLDAFENELHDQWAILQQLNLTFQTNPLGHADSIIRGYAASKSIGLALQALPLLQIRTETLDELWRDIAANYSHYASIATELNSALQDEL